MMCGIKMFMLLIWYEFNTKMNERVLYLNDITVSYTAVVKTAIQLVWLINNYSNLSNERCT